MKNPGKHKSRRSFLKMAGQGLLLTQTANLLSACGTAKQAQSGAPVKLLNSPNANLSLNVLDYGAKADGATKDTAALQQAIDRCSVLGGGEVLFPAGNYLTGALRLRSNTILRLTEGAVIAGTPDFADYPVTQVRWEGKWIPGRLGLIYALDAEDIGIVGPGKIAGNHSLGGRPNEKDPLRHPALIEPVNCRNIHFHDFSTDYHLMWSLHPTYCENIDIRNLTIRSTGGNGDGIDIDSCRKVVIDRCDIATGDDCISLKSGRGMEGYKLLRTTEDVTITNCTMADSIFACIGIGSETSGGIRNVRIENCTFTAAQTHAIYIKSRPGRGAFIENIVCNNLDVSGTKGGFLRFNLLGSGLQDQQPVPGREGIPSASNFSFTNIRVKDVPVLVDGISIHPDKPLQGFELKNVTGTCAKGISIANVRNASLKNIDVTGFTGALLSTHNVLGSGIANATALPPTILPAPVTTNTDNYKLH